MNLSSFKQHVISFTITFVSTFFLTILPGFGTIDYTKGAILALLVAGVRSGFKVAAEALTIVGPTTTTQ